LADVARTSICAETYCFGFWWLLNEKKFIFILVLVLFADEGVFSRETGSVQNGKHSVMIDIVPLFSGIIVGDSDLYCFGLAFIYEYNLVLHYSIGARFVQVAYRLGNRFALLTPVRRWFFFFIFFLYT
jgi:hypothetical protein